MRPKSSPSACEEDPATQPEPNEPDTRKAPDANPPVVDKTDWPLSTDEEEYLDRRPRVLKAAHNVHECKQELAEAELALDEAKTVVKGKEAALEAANDLLLQEVDGEEAEAVETPLFDGVKANTATPSAVTDEEWRKVELSALTFMDDGEMRPLKPTTLKVMREHEPSIVTLGDLTNWQKEKGDFWSKDIKGIGPTAAESISAACEEFWKTHKPTETDGKPSDAPVATYEAVQESAPESYDFESTFPIAINPTKNETYDAEYHRGIINDAIAAKSETMQFAEQLSSERGANGMPLSKKEKTKIQTTVGENEQQCKDNFASYSETFGERAGKALRKYIDKHATKKAALKGGVG